MNIKTATKKDAELIAAIISESNKGVAEQFGINIHNNAKHPSFCTKDWVLSDMGRGEIYFLFKESDAFEGCVAIEFSATNVAKRKTAYLNRLSVLPEHRRKGIGEALVKHLFAYAKTNECRNVSIGVIAEHTGLVNWYKKSGFKLLKKKKFTHLPFQVQFMTATDF